MKQPHIPRKLKKAVKQLEIVMDPLTVNKDADGNIVVSQSGGVVCTARKENKWHRKAGYILRREYQILQSLRCGYALKELTDKTKHYGDQ